MGKVPKTGSVPERHLYSRASYLHQVATYLAVRSQNIQNATDKESPPNQHSANPNHDEESKAGQNMARRFVSDIRTVSLKTQIQLAPAMKQTMCKGCDNLLIEGQTCMTTVENKSRGGKKPWADMMVSRCKTCGDVKRFPVSCPRQKRRPFRGSEEQSHGQPQAAVASPATDMAGAPP